MKVTQEKLPASQIGLQIEISAETSKQSYEKVVKNLASSSNIPGFRKGKVPRQVLLQRFGVKRLKAAALEEIIQESLESALKQEEIQPLGNYQLRSDFEELISQYEPGQPLKFSAAVDVSPEVELGEYLGLQIKAQESKYDPTQVDNVLKEKQKSKAIEVPVEDRPAQIQDVAYIDYEIFEANEEGQPGEKLPGVEGKDFKVPMIEDQFIPGFIAGIVGMKPEETKELPLSFPEDYGSEELAGKAVVFKITLKELKEQELPELDDELAKEVSEFETMEEWRQSIEKQFQEKADQETKSSIHQAILTELAEKTPVELPETMIEKEIDQILTQTAMQMQQYGIDLKQLFTQESIPAMRERSRPEAITRIKQSLIVTEIAKREGITPTPEAIEKRTQEVLKQLAGQEIDHARLEQMIQEEIVTEKTLDWLQEKATVELLPPGSTTKAEEESDEQIENQVEDQPETEPAQE